MRRRTRWRSCCFRSGTGRGRAVVLQGREAGSVDAAFNLGILHAGRGARTTRRRRCGGTSGRLPPGTPRRRCRSVSRGCGTGTSWRPSGICGVRRGAVARRPRTGWPPCSTPGGRRRPRTSSGSRRGGRIRGVVRAGCLPRASAGPGAGRDARRGSGRCGGGGSVGLRSAAEAGSRNGAFNLGLLLAREGSEPEAALWWTRAADAGHGRAALGSRSCMRGGGSWRRGSGGLIGPLR